MGFLKKMSGIALAAVMAAGVTAATPAAVSASDKPDTWIADRKVTIQAYVDDIGYSLPDDITKTRVWQEIKARTGIELEILYTPGEKDRFVMAAQLAADSIPDVIISYLNDSSRPEFPVLLKAARDGMFADLSEYFEDSTTYSKYLEDDFLPNDTKNNIMFRQEFDDAVYFVHLRIDRVDNSLVFRPDEDLVGGLYIQREIAEALDLDREAVKTMDDFYNLLVSIKEGGFTDKSGNPVYPLGPKYWGGSPDSLEYVLTGYDWGRYTSFYNMTPEPENKVLHEAETDYVFDKINFFRQLLAEELVNPEFFTMDSTRAEEVSKNLNSAIMADCHNYVDIIYESDTWVPLGPLNNYKGNSNKLTSGKSGYGMWAVSSEAKNPEEIFKLFDYLTSYEGKLLCGYGVEGVDYTMVDGMPKFTDEVAELVEAGDYDTLRNTVGAAYGGNAVEFYSFIQTDMANVEDFGEVRPGAGSDDDGSVNIYARAQEVANNYTRTIELVKGLNISGFLYDDSLVDVKPQLDMLNYNEMLVQAIYAPSDEEAVKIVESFREQLKAAGVEKYEALLEEVWENDNDAIRFYH